MDMHTYISAIGNLSYLERFMFVLPTLLGIFGLFSFAYTTKSIPLKWGVNIVAIILTVYLPFELGERAKTTVNAKTNEQTINKRLQTLIDKGEINLSEYLLTEQATSDLLTNIQSELSDRDKNIIVAQLVILSSFMDKRFEVAKEVVKNEVEQFVLTESKKIRDSNIENADRIIKESKNIENISTEIVKNIDNKVSRSLNSNLTQYKESLSDTTNEFQTSISEKFSKFSNDLRLANETSNNAHNETNERLIALNSSIKITDESIKTMDKEIRKQGLANIILEMKGVHSTVLSSEQKEDIFIEYAQCLRGLSFYQSNRRCDPVLFNGIKDISEVQTTALIN